MENPFLKKEEKTTIGIRIEESWKEQIITHAKTKYGLTLTDYLKMLVHEDMYGRGGKSKTSPTSDIDYEKLKIDYKKLEEEIRLLKNTMKLKLDLLIETQLMHGKTSEMDLETVKNRIRSFMNVMINGKFKEFSLPEIARSLEESEENVALVLNDMPDIKLQLGNMKYKRSE